MEFIRRLAAALGAVAVLVAVATAAGGGAPEARAAIAPDYRHALQVVADLRKYPRGTAGRPARRVVPALVHGQRPLPDATGP